MDATNTELRADRGGSRRYPQCILSATLALSVAAAFAQVPPASAAGDPVAEGSFTLSFSKGFQRQLKQDGVKVNRRKFRIKKGRVDPVRGAASLTLAGRLKFKRGERKRVFERVTVTLGRKGALRGDGEGLFRLAGGKLRRHGFGAEISGVKVKLVRRAARRLNRKLALGSLHRGRAGTAALSERPETVRVTEGRTTVTPSIGSGNDLAFKLFDHCVNPLTGIQAIAPAVMLPDATFEFPVRGGTVGPNGRAGVVLHAGGNQVSKNPLDNAGPCGGVADNVNIQQTGLQLDLGGNHVFGDAVINGYPPPLGGPKGVAIAFDIRSANASVDVHPKAKRVQIRGLVVVLSEASATYLNLVFPNSTGDPSREFRAGDVYGNATTTVRTR